MRWRNEGAYPCNEADDADRAAVADGVRGLDDRARPADLEDMVDAPAVGLQRFMSAYASVKHGKPRRTILRASSSQFGVVL